jgi:hypothetical protein
MLYIEDDNSVIYFSKTQNRTIKTNDPFSISKNDFFFLTKDEMIQLLTLQNKLENNNE